MSSEYKIVYTVDPAVTDPSSPSIDVPEHVQEQVYAHFDRILAAKGPEAAMEAVGQKLRLPPGVSYHFEKVESVVVQRASEMVEQFHHTYAQPVYQEPCVPDPDRTEMRYDLVAEEVRELREAIDLPHTDNEERKAWIIAMADALGDLLYVTHGMALEHGIDLDAVVAEIHRSNLSKLGKDGLPIYREDGKVLKGPDFSGPDLESVLFPEET